MLGQPLHAFLRCIIGSGLLVQEPFGYQFRPVDRPLRSRDVGFREDPGEERTALRCLKDGLDNLIVMAVALCQSGVCVVSSTVLLTCRVTLTQCIYSIT